MNPSTALARVVVDQLLRCGVTDFVLAPGSRSAPLSIELARREIEEGLRLHVRIDERSAGFLALGMAKESQAPVAVMCTSGSAVANLTPAVVEASYAGVPLVVITADRPPELRNVGSNQTIDQVGFFGTKVRRAIDFGPLLEQRGQVASAREQIARSIGHNDPVHINLGFREPLTPSDGQWIESLKSGIPAQTSEVPRARGPINREPINYALGDIGFGEVPARGVILVGDVPTADQSRQIVDLANACQWPIVTEPNGNVLAADSVVSSASLLLESEKFLENNRPELLISIGRFGLSRSTMSLVRGSARHIAIHLSGRDRPDPRQTAESILPAVPRPPDPASAPTLATPDANWLRVWQAEGESARAAVQSALTGGALWGLAVANAVWTSCTKDDLLFVAASRPIRDIELLASCRASAPRVVGNRGTSGIDGLVSTAWGAALVHQRRHESARTVALLGDLAFLHDHNGLIAPDSEVRPNLTIVVSDNNGGGIFSSLEQGASEFSDVYERVFGTPHGRDLVAIATAAGYEAKLVNTIDELSAQLAVKSGGVRVIVARTISRSQEQRLHDQLRGLVRAEGVAHR